MVEILKGLKIKFRTAVAANDMVALRKMRHITREECRDTAYLNKYTKELRKTMADSRRRQLLTAEEAWSVDVPVVHSDTSSTASHA